LLLVRQPVDTNNMAAFLEDRNRNVIPRWRDFRSTVELGELNASAPTIDHTDAVPDLSSVLDDWQKHKTVSFAGDLISAALVSGNVMVAREASEFVITLADNVSPSLRSLARRVLDLDSTSSLDTGGHFDLSNINAFRPSPEIANIRKRLVEYPSNAILWVDLAYFYAIRGSIERAERAIRIALNLAPANRFVLRSAARFFIHRDRVDIAHDLIRRAPGYKTDPWLVAAEIAVAMSAERTPWATKDAFALLGDDKFATHHLSELSSALGTLEFRNGRANKAKKLLRRSLIQATDNSLAQAQWISLSMNGLSTEMTGELSQIPRPYEANAGNAYVKGDWERSLQAALQWLEDQPFSSRPASMAVYLAAVIFENFSQAEQITNFGLIANPREHGLHISLAYCYASTGRFEKAIAELAMIDKSTADEWVHAAVDANFGLVAFRQGRSDEGRSHYAEAVRKAGLLRDKRTQVSALIHWASEEATLHNNMAEHLLVEAREVAKGASGSDIPFLLTRLAGKIAKENK
jgi:tetratricopeptide (TPR) repeat protein